ncbi:unnamed protein product [Ceratitis capitata]|uniref:(Mediterranean fruit fly) hypothetical protein n=1 Tax=Ceratitis capitata TaxID=7213 RepID=A0A811UWW7_CERCA|nr:unnamed protein product [Ceratitis capitata]
MPCVPQTNISQRQQTYLENAALANRQTATTTTAITTATTTGVRTSAAKKPTIEIVQMSSHMCAECFANVRYTNTNHNNKNDITHCNRRDGTVSAITIDTLPRIVIAALATCSCLCSLECTLTHIQHTRTARAPYVLRTYAAFCSLAGWLAHCHPNLICGKHDQDTFSDIKCSIFKCFLPAESSRCCSFTDTGQLTIEVLYTQTAIVYRPSTVRPSVCPLSILSKAQ